METPRLNVKKLDDWIAKNAPYGREKLALRCNRSVSFIDLIRRTGNMPRSYNLQSLAKALNCSMRSLVVKESRKD